MTFSADLIKNVASLPGVYQMKDDQGEVLYVGKASNLKKRLSSYLRYVDAVGTKTGVMLQKVVDVATTLTKTEKEALILEANLIKENRPKYNVILRDDKNYPLLKVTVQEEWPRLMMARRRGTDKALYFGPFSSASAMWDTLRQLQAQFPLRRCKHKNLKTVSRPCLNYQMKRCLAPCAGKVDHQTYMANVKNIILVLEGKSRVLIKKITEEMQEASRQLRFEQAAELRDKIRALEKTTERQIITSMKDRDIDVFALGQANNAAAVAVLHVRNGALCGVRNYPLGILGNADPDEQLFAEILERFYSNNEYIPAEIVVESAPAEKNLLLEWLYEKRRHSLDITVPSRGDKLRLIEMGKANALQYLAEKQKTAESWERISTIMRKRFGLGSQPARIACVDISNFQGEDSVGSVVSFLDGNPDPGAYRHFTIKSVQGPDDYASMNEVVGRYLENAASDGFLPDLLVADGGKGQLRITLNAVDELGLSEQIDTISLAKERQDEGEKIFLPGRKNPVNLKRHDPVLLFLMRIRDAAHRFGITHHRKKRARHLRQSDLDNIPGIGLAKKKLLLKSCGSVEQIKTASADDLASIKGIGPYLAKKIYSYFHP